MKNISKLFMLLVFTIFCSLGLFGQTKIVTQATSNSEIDKLYNLYKDKKTLSISTPHGNLVVSVGAYTNDEEKPKTVVIAGKSWNLSAVVAHLSNTINMKVKQGYRPIKNYTSLHGEYFRLIEDKLSTFNINNKGDYEMAFTKDKMNFLVRFGMNIITTPQKINGVTMYHTETANGFFWRIQISDTKREAGPNDSEFVF